MLRKLCIRRYLIIKLSCSTSQKGAALILVLWIVMLLASLALGLLLEVRTQVQLGNATLRGSQALIAAEAGLPLLIKELSGMATLSVSDSVVKIYQLDQATLSVEVHSENGKLDLNFCSSDAFLKLLRAEGAAPITSEVWVSQLESLRKSGKRLAQLEELLDLEGASFEVFERIHPMITVWSGRLMPDPGLASEPLRKALGLETSTNGSINLRAALEIRTTARLISGKTAVVSTVVLISPDKATSALYRILAWRVE